VLSYLGNALIVPGQPVSIGLPSGAQFIVLGFLLGPHVLGVVPSDAAARFMPLAIVAISWLALVLGMAWVIRATTACDRARSCSVSLSRCCRRS